MRFDPTRQIAIYNNHLRLKVCALGLSDPIRSAAAIATHGIVLKLLIISKETQNCLVLLHEH